MKNLRLIIGIIILFVFQSVVMIGAFFILKNLFFVDGDNSLISQQEKLFLIASFLVVALVSIIFVVLIIRISLKEKEVVVKNSLDSKVDNAAERKKKRLEEQQKLSDIEKKRNKMINNLMQGLNAKLDMNGFSEKVLANLAKQYELVQGMVFIRDENDIFKKRGAYAIYKEDEVKDFKEGIGITGQVAISKELINISNLPEKYLTVLSGLGSAAPANLIIFPILNDNTTVGIVEIATFVKMDKLAEQVLKVLSRRIGEQIIKIKAPEKA